MDYGIISSFKGAGMGVGLLPPSDFLETGGREKSYLSQEGCEGAEARCQHLRTFQTSPPRLPSCHVWVTILFVALSCSPLYCVVINKLHVTRNSLLRHALPRRLPEAPLNLNCSRGISVTLMLTDAHPASSTAVIGFNLTQSCLLIVEPKLCSLTRRGKY